MKRAVLTGVASALILTACAGARTFYTEEQPRTRGYSLAFASPPNPTAPNIFVVDEKIVIDQEPIRPPGNQQGDPITIYFAIPEEGDYSFRDHGIEIQGHPDYCNPVTGNKYLFKCRYSRPASGTPPYKYAVRLKNDRTGNNLRDLDPTIWN
jgi:hypothetical protein